MAKNTPPETKVHLPFPAYHLIIMRLSIVVSLILSVSCHSLFVLVPLYLYPHADASAWSNITAAIAGNTEVQWQIIVNPNSGPYTYPPDANYIAAVSKLNSYPNVVTVGYIATGYTKVPFDSVTSQIDLYAQWASYPSAAISIAGIFFDEVDNTAAENVYTYYRQAANYVKDNMPSAVSPVVFNPGTSAPAQLFDYADTVVQYESAFSSYKDKETLNALQPGFNDQTCIIIYNTPDNADVKSLVRSMVEEGIQSVYFGADCCYHVFSSELLTLLASAVLAG
ncbi:MAG: hypothetical protein Q9173_001499 [Seirophora scorigena]